MPRLKQLVSSVLAGASLTLSAGAFAAFTADDILQVITPAERKSLLLGDIVTVARPRQESDDSGLAIGLGVLVPADLNKTLSTLRSISVANDPALRRTTREITGDVPGDGTGRAFSAIRFDDDEGPEVKKLLAAKPGNDFNFSPEELGWIRAAGDTGNPAATAARVMRRVLESRYLAYTRSGLEGMPPYARRGQSLAHPGSELAASADTLTMVANRLPVFFRNYRHYPKISDPDMQHKIFWEKKTVEKRPVFSLRHELVQVQTDGAVIGNREFYISNQLNGLQVVILLIPYREQTLVVMLNETYTEKVSGTGRFVAVHVGRSIVESNTKPMFEKLQQQLGRAKPVADVSGL